MSALHDSNMNIMKFIPTQDMLIHYYTNRPGLYKTAIPHQHSVDAMIPYKLIKDDVQASAFSHIASSTDDLIHKK